MSGVDLSHGPHHILAPMGPQAARILHLLTFIAVTSIIVYALVIAAWVVAARRGSVRRARGEPADEGIESERAAMRRIGLAAGLCALLLLAYVGASAVTGRRLAAMGADDPADRPLTIEVTGKQWWWEFRYHDPDPSRRLTTANELHIPVGTRIQVIGTASDVIHSFWVPNLHGKQDLIPGYRQTTWFRADSVGTFVGECAEFCGHEHARMRFLVVVEPKDAFARWYASNLAPATEPADSLAAKGRDVFLSNGCVMCHAIGGTLAGSRIGPELTHVGSRAMLAAGSIPNTRGHLAGWILDPQGIKPGVRMPPNALSPADLDALLTYLQSLK